MANKLDALLKLTQQRRTDDYSANQQGGNDFLSQIASIGNTITPANTDMADAITGFSRGVQTGNLNIGRMKFMQGLQEIAQSQASPEEKINALVGLKAQHGQDYGFGIDDIVKQYGELAKTNATSSKQTEWKPQTKEEAIAFEEAKLGAKRANPSPAEQKAQLDLEDRQKRMEFAAQDVKDAANDALDTIKEVEAGIKNFGIWGSMPSIPGTARAKWEANIDKLLSQNVLNVMNSMKQASRTGATGFGALNAQELKVLKDASTALKRGLAPDDAKQILDKMKIKLNKIANGQPNSAPNQPNQPSGIGQTKSGLKYKVVP